MAEQDDQKVEVHPPSTIPTVFADGLANLAHSPNIVKFYLARFDPSLDGRAPAKLQVFTQVVMPLAGFVDTVVFLQGQLGQMVQRGTVTQEHIDDAQKRFAERQAE